MNLAEVEGMQLVDSDISSHYKRMYLQTLNRQPKLIVELGISQKGDSSKIFSLINEEIDSHVIGVDIVRCPYDFVKNGLFVCRDDIAFAKDFKKLVVQTIDVLFIDTSHLYEHTVQEIKAWFPFLSEKALIMFHDTNLKQDYLRENGTRGIGWDNERGVIRAIEEYFEQKFDESKQFSIEILKDGYRWSIEHWPLCNGFTFINKSVV